LAVSLFDSPESDLERMLKILMRKKTVMTKLLNSPSSRNQHDLQLSSSLYLLGLDVFLNSNVESLVIISDKLSEEETAKLIAILEKHRPVFRYALQDLKGISAALCTHRIPLDPEMTPSREPQRRLNNAMREVVKKEVLKLLHAGIIYPVPHSEWVSPV